jgi:hypothetical protein
VKVSISVSFASVRGKTNMVFSVMISFTTALLFFGIVKYEVDAMGYGCASNGRMPRENILLGNITSEVSELCNYYTASTK